ncbi:glycosyltransferase family 2 protein [Guptibacillus algicola]|uniref:glycosyltransferase family 2 protein n=1 Tax=Guptibacillus algicola TaxID=225844 RepID=UPI001CD597F2|nr:glycosyltransferase [Alkalihalobacillus algicola]MCA0987858.1 glycosyltransferase [Alkalihalobacillus algicola]
MVENRKGKKEYEVSVIIPTYNKFPQNLFTLISLQNQIFDLTKVEVLLIDDGSTDETRQIINHHSFSFDLKYMDCGRNIGRAAARNKGVMEAKGKILIFLDAEIMVKPNFLKIHYDYHKRYENAVVTGILFIKRLYSVLFKDFSDHQIEECYELSKSSPSLKEKLQDFQRSKGRKAIISITDIYTQSYQTLALPTKYEAHYQGIIIDNYGYKLTNYRIPWQLFGTGHVSVSKEAIERVGLFAEYPGYGWDDCEMGYRLYKDGAQYLTDPRLISYHQEHPVSALNKDESKSNYYRFQETYRSVDCMIISLTFLPVPFNLHEVNQILINYHKLCEGYSNDFTVTKRVFSEMLREIGKKASNKEALKDLIPKDLSEEQINKLHKELALIREKKEFALFLECFDRLEKL